MCKPASFKVTREGEALFPPVKDRQIGPVNIEERKRLLAFVLAGIPPQPEQKSLCAEQAAELLPFAEKLGCQVLAETLRELSMKWA